MYYQVWGEHGPLACDYIAANVLAEGPEQAKAIFIWNASKLSLWNRIGAHNVYVHLTVHEQPDPQWSTWTLSVKS